MVNKGRIHRELTNFLMKSSNLIKSDKKFMVEIGKWYFKKEDFKSISRNQESSNLDLISRRNRNLKWRENFRRENRDFR